VTIDFGETYSSPNYVVKDTSGTPTNAGTVTAVITLPDSVTTASPTVVNTSAGTYSFDYGTTVAGRHELTVSATGGILGTLVRKWTDSFTVSPAGSGFGLSLDDAKAHLNIKLTYTADDEELRDWLSIVTRLVESKAGEITAKAYTERHRGGKSLWLRHTPVIAVTSVGPWLNTGTTFLPSTVRVDPETGRLERLDGGWFTGGPYAITYTAGRQIVPANLRGALKIILQHLWDTQRGASGLPFQPSEDVGMIPGFAFAIPNRAIELLAPDLLGMNLA
jgi:hypothetical protein